MPDEQRLIDLERELIETRRAAVSIAVDLCRPKTPAERARIAHDLDVGASICDAPHARLSRLIAAALRLG